jgi:hypothetical protein
MNPLSTLMILLQTVAPAPTPVPRVQAVPLAHREISFRLDGRELARYHSEPGIERPFLFPIIGPSGQMLTRMGHPHDPVTHSHHDSVWVAHSDVNGVDFWTDGDTGRIVTLRIRELGDSDAAAWAVAENEWSAPGGKVLLRERRRIAAEPLSGGEWMLVADIELEPAAGEAVFGKTPFGMVGVRMAKSIGVSDGGGVIRNSEGGVNEKEVLWKRARWVDYSGAVSNSAIEGITLMDHSANPNHPTYFHVRNDGWMGTSLTYDAPRRLGPGEKLKLRYGLYVHSGRPAVEAIERRWEAFSASGLKQ